MRQQPCTLTAPTVHLTRGLFDMWVGCIWWVVAWLMLSVCTNCRGSTPSVPQREDLASGQYELKWFEHPFHTLNQTEYITLGALWYTVKYNPSCGCALRILQRICAAKWTTDSVNWAGQGMSVKWDSISFYQKHNRRDLGHEDKPLKILHCNWKCHLVAFVTLRW